MFVEMPKAIVGGVTSSKFSKVAEHVNSTATTETTATITGLGDYEKIMVILSTSFQAGVAVATMRNSCLLDNYEPIGESGFYKNSNSSSHLVRTYLIDNVFGDTYNMTGKWLGYQVYGVN